MTATIRSASCCRRTAPAPPDGKPAGRWWRHASSIGIAASTSTRQGLQICRPARPRDGCRYRSARWQPPGASTSMARRNSSRRSARGAFPCMPERRCPNSSMKRSSKCCGVRNVTSWHARRRSARRASARATRSVWRIWGWSRNAAGLPLPARSSGFTRSSMPIRPGASPCATRRRGARRAPRTTTPPWRRSRSPACWPSSAVAARDAVLFLWATNPMLLDGCARCRRGASPMHHWIWDGEVAGTRYWGRDRHELLLIGRRGDAVAPLARHATGDGAPRAQGSHRPLLRLVRREQIERLYPGIAKIELFACAAPGLGCLGI